MPIGIGNVQGFAWNWQRPRKLPVRYMRVFLFLRKHTWPRPPICSPGPRKRLRGAQSPRSRKLRHTSPDWATYFEGPKPRGHRSPVLRLRPKQKKSEDLRKQAPAADSCNGCALASTTMCYSTNRPRAGFRSAVIVRIATPRRKGPSIRFHQGRFNPQMLSALLSAAESSSIRHRRHEHGGND